MKTLLMTVAVLLVLAMAVQVVAAADKPDFSGEWTMSPAKSNFGAVPAPESIRMKITHTEPRLTIEVSQRGPGGYDTKVSYLVGGREVDYEVAGSSTKGRALWDGDSLVTVAVPQDGSGVEIRARMTLAADGTLSDVVRMQTPTGPLEFSLVFERTR